MGHRIGTRRTAALAIVLSSAAAFAVAGGAAEGQSGTDKDVLAFDTMAGVTDAFTGPAHPVRGLPGGGLPWELARGAGTLRADGLLKVNVRGLVLARRDPVPPALQGTNPVPQFRGAVNCLTTTAPEAGETVMTAPVPATPTGDAQIKERLALPQPCVAPVVFVTSPTGAWFSVSGR